MAHEFHLPDIGEGLAEAVIVEWHVEVGGEVGLDAPLVEVETDKAVVDIPSPHAGVLLHQGGAAGDTIEVEALLAVVGEAGEIWEQGDPVGESAAAAPIVGRLDETAETIVRGDRARILPRLRRLAEERGVDVDRLPGTGPRGTITEADIEGAADDIGPARRTRMSPTRRAIAENLSRSWREIPHVTTYAEVDADALLEARAALGKPPLEALLIHRIVPLLAEFPLFNASISGDQIVEHLRYDIGFAVDGPEGLMVAVVRDAASLLIAELADEITRLAVAVRDRSVRPDELRGQTFTLSNIGAVGGRYGTPIVPHGTTSILSIGRADPRPVVRDGAVVVGREFPLSLSYDHRIIDGAMGRAFLSAVGDRLGRPN
jgi:pyruvate dehydrogenase E2 component (dihydrolipoamide acetyltransferase)